MSYVENFFAYEPFSKDKEWKKNDFREAMVSLTKHHMDKCKLYQDILVASGFTIDTNTSIEDIPFIPAGLFKSLNLSSVPTSEIKRTLTSSGTSRNVVSMVNLDSKTSILQMRVLATIISDLLGSERLPMLIIDTEHPYTGQGNMSTRLAAIQGFSIFGKERTYILDEKMMIDRKKLDSFIENINGRPFFIFGFTYIIWEYLIKVLENSKSKIDLSNGIVLHGGGWKKLIEQKVSDKEFKQKLNQLTGVQKVHNYYGMVEQTGSIYIQCEFGHLHCSIYSDVIIRDPIDFSECEFGREGIIQTMSVLPWSYPGHNILTEDKGVLLGEDDCKCGRKGKYFKVIGRLENAELKGCGDTYVRKS